MRYQIQIHFENQGQIVYFKTFSDRSEFEQYMIDVDDYDFVHYDDEAERMIHINLGKVLAIIGQPAVETQPIVVDESKE